MSSTTITIFPLGTVLFPGGVLPLRIFEARYVDMVRECMRNSIAFGVCRITNGMEAGTPADHEQIGCSARIVNFDSEANGLLNIRTIGEQRFRILERETTSAGLVKATVEWINLEEDLPIPADMRQCATVVEEVISELVETEHDPMRRVLEPPYLLDSATWVSNRLCEILPFAPHSKQLLLELNDPLQRLSIVNQVIQKHAKSNANLAH